MARLDAEAEQKRDVDGRTVLECFSSELPAMVPLPSWRFVPAEVLSVEATRSALVKVKGGHYSVWSQWAGMTLTAYAGVDAICGFHASRSPVPREADRAFHAKPITRAGVTRLVVSTSTPSACWSSSRPSS